MSGNGAMISMQKEVRPVSCAAAVGTAMPGTAGRLTATATGQAIAVAILVCALSEVKKDKEGVRVRGGQPISGTFGGQPRTCLGRCDNKYTTNSVPGFVGAPLAGARL